MLKIATKIMTNSIEVSEMVIRKLKDVLEKKIERIYLVNDEYGTVVVVISNHETHLGLYSMEVLAKEIERNYNTNSYHIEERYVV